MEILKAQFPYKKFFNEHCVENIEDIDNILKISAEDIHKKFGIRYGYIDKNTGTKVWIPEMIGVSFIVFFDQIFKHLKSLQKDYDSFIINIANRLECGFSNDDDESMQLEGVDNEIMGNFCPFIQHIEKRHGTSESEGRSSAEKCSEWIASNVTENIKVIDEISSDTKKDLKDLGVRMPNPAYMCPTFITVYENLINYIREKRRELDLFQYEVNFLNCFFITCIETDEGDEIRIRPNIRCKLDIKDNQKASSKYEA